MVITMVEDGERLISLSAISMDASSTELETTVLSLPAKGSLYEVRSDGSRGRRIVSAPRAIRGGSVFYAPDKNGFSEVGEAYAEFTYSASALPLRSTASAPVRVQVVVTAADDAPRLTTPNMIEEMMEGTELVFECASAVPVDAESRNFSYVVTTLPTVGTLYQADGKTRFVAPSTAVADPRGRVLYVPPPNAKGFPLTTF
eukprot:4734152-Pyramimonas_sp.AAC.1